MRLGLVLALAFIALGCTRPSEEDCRTAILNLQKLRNLEGSPNAPDVEGAVRKCRAGASHEAVNCIIAAKTAADADACEKKK